MARKVALFAFNGDPMCFVHALLNAEEMHARGYEIKVIIEGSATRQVRELAEQEGPVARLYAKIREAGLIDCVCRACVAKMGALAAAEAQGLPLCGEMTGHPSIGRYLEDGFEVLIM